MSSDDARAYQPGIIVAVGDPERERRLLGALADGGMRVAGRCLDGPSLIEQTKATGIGAAIASTDLHRLSRDVLVAIAGAGVPLVLLVAPDEVQKFEGLGYLLPADSAGPAIVAAVQDALRRGSISSQPAATQVASVSVPSTGGRADGCKVIALVSGKGAPGATTVAIGLSGAIARTGKKVLLVDGDLRGGSIGPYLDLDPRKGLVGLTVMSGAEPPDLSNELQPCSSFSVLAGLERPEMRERLQADHIPLAMRAVGRRFDTVVIDLGETLAGAASPGTVAFLRLADVVLVVTTADLMGLWNARSCLRYLGTLTGLPVDAVSVVVNRHAGREQHSAVEVERALGAPVLAVVPDDVQAARNARRQQAPFAAGGGRAASQLGALATKLLQGEPTAVDEVPATERARWHWRRQPAEGRR